MSPFAQTLVGALSGLPGAGLFVAVGLVALLPLAGGVFALRDRPLVEQSRRLTRRLLEAATAALLIAMVVLSGLQILLRNAWESGLLWIDPLLRHFVLLLAFLGALTATGQKRHLQINVLGRLLTGGWSRVLGTAVAGVGAAVCLALAHAALQLLVEEIPTGEIAFLSIPTWAVIAIFPVSFLGMAFRMLLLAFEEAAGIAPPTDAEPIPHEGAA